LNYITPHGEIIMRKIFFIIIILTGTIFQQTFAQSPEGKNFGFGLVLGEPTGLTLKFWTQRNNAFVIDVGESYFGSPRIGLDYLWHFDAFRSNVAKLYAGFGGVVGIGRSDGFYYSNHNGFFYRSDNGLGLGVRGVFGVNVVPERSPIELFLEVGLLVGLSPAFGSAGDVGLGIRYYP
jgi:hypothetical protein